MTIRIDASYKQTSPQRVRIDSERFSAVPTCNRLPRAHDTLCIDIEVARFGLAL